MSGSKDFNIMRNTVDTVARVIFISALWHSYNSNSWHVKASNYSSGGIYFHPVNACEKKAGGWLFFVSGLPAWINIPRHSV